MASLSPSPRTCTWAEALGADRGRRGRPAAILLPLCLGAACGPGLPVPADLVLLNGAIVTMDSIVPRAEGLAIRDGRVVFVGDMDAARRLVGPSTQVLQLEGRTVLPAFVDAHIHPVTGGLERVTECDLSEQPTATAIFARLRSCVAELPDSVWLLGANWQLPAFPDAAPRKEWLDSIAADRPAYLTAADHHSAWVNSRALELAGITRRTKDPQGGRIERNRRGEPTGTLREAAMELVASLKPRASAEQRRDGLRHAIGLLSAAGVTSVMEASADRAILETYRALELLGGLDVRVVAALRADPEAGAGQVDSFVAWRTEFSSERLRPDAVKVFLDGVIEARTAAMLAPYSDRRGWAGEPNWTAAALDSLARAAVGYDFSLHIHAIGDRAVRMALDAIERAEADRPRGGRRHQISHLQVIDTADVRRFAELNVIANFQPLWAYPDSYIVDLTWPALGPARSRRLYPIGDLHRARATLAFGSDWNVTSLVPLEGIEVAVTRRDPEGPVEGEPGGALLPEQAIDLPSALRAYTLGAAYGLGLDSLVGSLTVGKVADVVILDRNLLSTAPEEISRASVLLTLLAGRPVFGSLDSLSAR